MALPPYSSLSYFRYAWPLHAVFLLELADLRLVHERYARDQALIASLRTGARPDVTWVREAWMRTLVHSCWEHDPSLRISFAAIVTKLDNNNNDAALPLLPTAAPLVVSASPPTAESELTSSFVPSLPSPPTSLTYGDGGEAPTLVLDAVRTITQANRALADLAGYARRSDLVGKRLDNLVAGGLLFRADDTEVEVELLFIETADASSVVCCVRDVRELARLRVEREALLVDQARAAEREAASERELATAAAQRRADSTLNHIVKNQCGAAALALQTLSLQLQEEEEALPPRAELIARVEQPVADLEQVRSYNEHASGLITLTVQPTA